MKTSSKVSLLHSCTISSIRNEKNIFGRVLRGGKVNSQTKNAWSKLVSAYNMHISTSLPKKVSGVHRFEPTTAGTGEPVWGAKIR